MLSDCPYLKASCSYLLREHIWHVGKVPSNLHHMTRVETKMNLIVDHM